MLRRKVTNSPEQSVSSLAALQQTVRNESAELRRMVTDLRPLRVQSADLVDLMTGFAERYRNESTLALDVLIDSAEIHAPDRVCREIFQIYREALNNIKKHAKASHVVVKLSQDDSRSSVSRGRQRRGLQLRRAVYRRRIGPVATGSNFHQGAYAYCWGDFDGGVEPWSRARLIIEIPLG